MLDCFIIPALPQTFQQFYLNGKISQLGIHQPSILDPRFQCDSDNALPVRIPTCDKPL